MVGCAKFQTTMKKTTTAFTLLLTTVFIAGLMPGSKASHHNKGGSGPNYKKEIRKCGGTYKGYWMPTCENTQTNAKTPWAMLPLCLKVPKSGKGWTNGKIDVYPEHGGSNPHWIETKTRFKKPKVRRSGKLKIWRGNTIWKTGGEGIGSITTDISGTFKIKVSHKGRKYSIDQGNCQYFDPTHDRKYYGQIYKAKK